MKKERKGKLVGRVVLLSVAFAVIVGVIIGVLGIVEVKNTYFNMVQEELRVACVQAESEFTNVWDGEWRYDDATLTKGEEEVYDEYLEIMESAKALTGLEYTIFYGDTRACTTLKDGSGNYLVGTTASAAIVEEVIKQGHDAYKQNLDIGGVKFYGYYTPLQQDDGTIVGMMFSGRRSADVTSAVNRVTTLILIVIIIGGIALMLFGTYMAVRSGKAMKSVAHSVDVLASGDLSVRVEEKHINRNDELGIIADNVNELATKLREIMGNAKNLSDNVSHSGDELSDSSQHAANASALVTNAVDDISKGAVSQAESVQDSVGNVNHIGEDIDTISNNVTTLSDYAGSMKQACQNSMKALEVLLEQNVGVVTSMAEIDAATRNTNDAVQNITNATQLITDIASQTNLLALNASIEAARAGEAGRGFAVVADEIKDLADQSSKSAEEIKRIIDELALESSRSVETIERLNADLDNQSKQIDETKGVMEEMERGVISVTEGTDEIAGRIRALDEAKNNLLSIIEDLSAISEENAASSEQTNASMQELNATFEVINQSADELKGLAAQLDQQISFFRLDA